MGILQKILSGKNVETVAKTLEEGVEKIVQYGQRTLKVMKPKTQVYSYYNGGMAVPQSMEGYYAEAGMKPTGHFLQTTKDVFITKGDVVDKMTIETTKGLDGLTSLRTQSGKNITLGHNYGTNNAYQTTMSINPYGKTFYLN